MNAFHNIFSMIICVSLSLLVFFFREMINKENIPSGCGSLEDCGLMQEVEKLQENCSGYIEERSKPKRQKSSSKLSELNDNQDSTVVGDIWSCSQANFLYRITYKSRLRVEEQLSLCHPNQKKSSSSSTPGHQVKWNVFTNCLQSSVWLHGGAEMLPCRRWMDTFTFHCMSWRAAAASLLVWSLTT